MIRLKYLVKLAWNMELKMIRMEARHPISQFTYSKPQATFNAGAPAGTADTYWLDAGRDQKMHKICSYPLRGRKLLEKANIGRLSTTQGWMRQNQRASCVTRLWPGLGGWGGTRQANRWGEKLEQREPELREGKRVCKCQTNFSHNDLHATNSVCPNMQVT